MCGWNSVRVKGKCGAVVQQKLSPISLPTFFFFLFFFFFFFFFFCSPFQDAICIAVPLRLVRSVIVSVLFCDVVSCHAILAVPSEHTTLRQRRINVDATSWRCIDVNATLYKRHLPVFTLLIHFSANVYKGGNIVNPLLLSRIQNPFRNCFCIVT